MSRLLLISIIILLSSCSKSIYYAYEEDGKYATMEISNKDRLIYRAYDGSTYMYIRDNTYFDEKYGYSFDIDNPLWMHFKREHQNKFDFCYFLKNDEAIYYKNVKYDSIRLIGDISKNKFLETEPCFKNNNIKWFPPYLKRVDKIDYKKFKLPDVNDKYLKNPQNAPKMFE